jgi:hypothetical protein
MDVVTVDLKSHLSKGRTKKKEKKIVKKSANFVGRVGKLDRFNKVLIKIELT